MGVDPEEFWRSSRDLPYTTEISWASSAPDGRYDVVFRRASSEPTAAPVLSDFSSHEVPPLPWGNYVNEPLQEGTSSDLVPQLRDFLAEKLPDYMVPAAYVLLDQLPLSANGKLDRAALPAPENLRPELESSYVLPRNEVERQIVEIWQQALGLDRVGIRDNFFDIGGHSLLMAEVLGRLREHFSTKLKMIDLFKHPTVDSLAGHLSDGGETGTTEAAEDLASKLSQGKQRLQRLSERRRTRNKGDG